MTPWTVAHQAPLSMGFFQARILKWVAIPFSGRSSQPRDQICISYIGRWVLYHWASWETSLELRTSKGPCSVVLRDSFSPSTIELSDKMRLFDTGSLRIAFSFHTHTQGGAGRQEVCCGTASKHPTPGTRYDPAVVHYLSVQGGCSSSSHHICIPASGKGKA